MKIVKIEGQIELLSGLHIGGGDDVMRIGGIDNPVIKDINSNKPYIPGSSLKGKMRSLLEWYYGLVGVSGGDVFSSKFLDEKKYPQITQNKAKAELLLKIFGDSGDKSEDFGITRISVGDCKLSKESENLKHTEAKYENVIDRKSGTASNPRQTERVPAGVKFDFDIRVKILNDDNKEDFLKAICTALKLVEYDYLGGNGSRGYGRVKFHLNHEEYKKVYEDIKLGE
ncbi:MAG: type III-A CRISPR-associated RAMP protein Csm3 [Campylobacterales bacterium]|nr:type III-A CRISPR-associated RAMP protein Csm3 [Campylobacterales bacterium]